MDKTMQNLTTCEEAALVYAARYARSRQTGAAAQVVSAIIGNLDQISEQTKQQLIREDHEATCNKDDWERLRRAILRENSLDMTAKNANVNTPGQ